MLSRLLTLLVLVGLLLAGLASPCRATDPFAKPPRGPLDPLRYRDLLVTGASGVRQLEIVEMLAALAGDSQMGPGDGWFHPGQGRYGWDWLAARHGIDHAG